MKRTIKGFTLIEVMITVVIVAILASIAYPSYISYVSSAAETQVRGELVDLAAAQERWRAQNFQYTSTLSDLGTQLPNNDKYSTTLTVTSSGQGFNAIVIPKSGTVVEGGASFKINEDGTTCFKVNASDCTLGTDPVWSDR
jgi:type IV pilus assembly protein PilE